MLAKANLGEFQHLCNTHLHQSAMGDADDPMSLFTSILKDIAEETSPVESLNVDAYKPILYDGHTMPSLQYASKIKSLPKHSTHDAVFDNKYMKLFDASPNAIRTFGQRIKQFLTTSNIDFSDILETPLYFVLPP